jgi:hypothetical protein
MKRVAVLALTAALSVAGVAIAGPHAKTAARFEVVGRANPGLPYTADVSALRDHAYLSSWGGRSCRSLGVRVYDLRDPSRPRHVSTFADGKSQPRLDGSWTEKTIVRTVDTPSFTGDLAVTSLQECRRDGMQGFALYDVSDPANPRELALVPTQPRGSHEIWLQRVGRRVYVWTAIIASERRSSPDNGTTPGDPDFRIFDVSDPTRPRQVGSWGAWRALGLRPDRIETQTLDWNFVHSVTGNAAGTRAYLSYWDLGTVILDVSNPARPRYLGRTARAPGGIDNAHSTWTAQSGRMLIETHERDGGRPTFWNIANPRKPVRLGEFRLPRAVIAVGRGHRLDRVSGLDLGDSVHDVKVQGKVALFSWYRQGVVAADISNPRKPRFLARFLPPATADPGENFCPGAHCISVWGVFVTPKYVLASDMVGGLFVLRLRR